MIIFPVNAFTSVFLPLVWVLDAYLVLAILRIVLQYSYGGRFYFRSHAVRNFVERPVAFARARLSRWRGQQVSSWIPWAAVILVVGLTRQLLVNLVFSVS